MDPDSGVLSGVVTSADAESTQPLRVIVIGQTAGKDDEKKVLELTIEGGIFFGFTQ